MGFVLLIMFVFTDNVSCVMVTLMVFLIDLNLLGVMYWWGVSVSCVSFVTLVMSVGLSVDYCVHVGHAFAHSLSGSPNERAVEALRVMGGSVLKGGFTTLLGACVLAFSSSNAFRVFFKMLFATVVLGLVHGLVALPIFVSVFFNVFASGKASGRFRDS